MSIKGKRVAFLGAGNMGEALIKGLTQTGLVPAGSITASDPRADHLEQEVLRDELTVALGKTLEHGKGLRHQANRLRPSPQTRIVRIEPKRREAELPRRSHIH